MSKELFKEAIADAKAVREAALANLSPLNFALYVTTRCVSAGQFSNWRRLVIPASIRYDQALIDGT